MYIHITTSQEDPDMSQRPAYLYLKNNFYKQENNELKELSECMLYKMLVFSENVSKL